MSLRFEVPAVADAVLIVTALHIAGGAVQAEQTAEEPQRFLRLAFEISAGLLSLEQRVEMQRRFRESTKPRVHADQRCDQHGRWSAGESR